MRALPPPARPALLALLLLLGGCLDDSDHRASRSGGGSPPPPVTAIAPDYWPTTAWQTANPDTQGFIPGAFDTLAADAAAALPYHTSLLVIRNGWLLHESYHDTASVTGVTADRKHHVWSISKSVTALTIGRALTRGDLSWDALDATVGETLPAAAWNGLPAGDPRLGIRLVDVLRMRSGLAWNEATDLLQTNRDPLFRTAYGLEPNCPGGSEQILCGVLQKPLAYAPGTVWNYNTYDTYLASGLFSNLLPAAVTERRLGTYADAHLFAPLGILADATDWWDLPSAYTYGGGLLHITSRDLAKIGLLALYDGNWEGSQLIHPDWMTLALTAQGEGLVARFDDSGAPAGTTTAYIPYGLQWWRVTGPGLGGMPSISARGLGGQMMHVYRDKELVVLITCDDNFSDDRSAEINAFLNSHVLERLTP